MSSTSNRTGNIRGPAGPAGDQGPAGPAGPAPWTVPVPWTADTAFTSAPAPASAVTFNGGTYVCTTSHTSGSSFDATKFTQLVAPGAPGAQGARGASLFSGVGAPAASVVAQAVAGQDSYLDTSTGDLYAFS